MGLVGTLLRPESRISTGTLANPPQWLIEFLGAGGNNVSATGSLSYGPVYACVRVISSTIAALPLITYKRLAGGGKARDPNHPLYELLHDAPNPEMTAVEFRESLCGHLCLWGNAYALIRRGASGAITELWPLRPDRMRVVRASDTAQPVYFWRQSSGAEIAIPNDQILHIRGLSTDGLTGLSPISAARQAITMGMTMEAYGNKFFSNDSRPGGVLKHPGKLSKDGAERLKSSWEAAHRGIDQSHRVAVLEEGMNWEAVGLPPQDAQWLETRRYQELDICRFFGVPPHMIGNLERATFSNIEEQAREFVDYTLSPWLKRWEQAIYRDLLQPSERPIWFAEHLLDYLLRGNTLSRYQAYAVGRSNGWLSANDIRDKENMNPLPGKEGDIYLVPLNMVPADQLNGSQPGGVPITAGSSRVVTPTPEERQGGRARIAARWERLFHDAASRIVRRESTDIRVLVAKWLARRDAVQFGLALEEYYRKHPDYVQRTFAPLLITYAGEVAGVAGQEIGVVGEEMTPELEEFMRGYSQALAGEWSYSSRGQLSDVVMTAEAAGDDPEAAINTRLTEWQERRPEKVADEYTMEALGAVSLFVWKRHGIRRIKWQSHSACPICAKLHNKVVGIEEGFLGKGDELAGEVGETPFKANKQYRHPPLHGKCKCSVHVA